MLTSRLLGCRQPCTQFVRNISFFRSRKDPSTEPVNTEQVSLENKSDEPKNIIIPKRQLPFMNEHMTPRQAWVENFDTIEKNILGLIDLHPKVFGCEPRIDVIHENIVWQKKYRYIRWAVAPVQIEVNKSTRKPWPQKGTGRARHGTRRSHIFQGGAVCHGPRGPKTHFYMLSTPKRLLGLCATLSIKLAQDDIHFIDRLDIPTDDPNYLLDLAEQRKWGASVLFVDVPDVLTRNMALALDKIPQFMAMPVYGLNCYSMLKFETLVLTLDAVDRLEEKILQVTYDPFTRTEPFSRKHLQY